MKSSEIRKRFFDFFTNRNHTMVPSSSLIPAQDPTLLFANAGMNQFKDVFLGQEKRSYKRAVSIQKCVRAGGKHNDLDNVGFTKRHLTFFEMMGNFSFGDYFKKDAILFAWEFITKEAKLPKEKLCVSVFETDDESFAIWEKQVGVPSHKIFRLGQDSNFWQMGNIGPCGPCTEIFIDRGPEFGCEDEKKCGPACGCDRFLEIWNLVFMQFDRQEDGSLNPLSQTGVDTGMGLERLCAVLQDKDSVYETDLFMPIIMQTEKLTGLTYDKQPDDKKAAFRVIADHIRSSSMIIADGGAPSNEGRGYVLRKIIRRAALFVQKLTDKNIFPELAKVVVKEFGDVYPELRANETLIVKILTSEIEKFAANLIRGQQILKEFFEASKKAKKITGEQAFKLYDTFGFPIELVQLIANEQGYSVDMKGFEDEMAKQQAMSGKKTADPLDHVAFEASINTEFTGYQELETKSQIIALVQGTQSVASVAANTECWVIAKKSPFFIVGGGQVPDEGHLVIGTHKTPVKIKQVRYINGRIAALITAPIAIKVGDAVISSVDPVWRTNAMKNHTATHLLQAALIELFGKQIKQSGSLVHPDYLRFDFTYHENLSTDDIKKVEDLVNAKIRENIAVQVEYTSLGEATKRGVLAFFGEKYNPEQVRIVNVPHFSMELCGGTHVSRTGDIGAFKITEVSALSAGHRRIVALTGPRAVELFQGVFNITKSLSQYFKIKREEIVGTVEKQAQLIKDLQKQTKTLKQHAWRAQLPQWIAQIETVNQIPFTHLALDADHEDMREISQLLQAQKPGLYVLTNAQDSRSLFLASISPNLAKRIDVKKFGSWLNETHGLRGGGTGTVLQGGGGKINANFIETLRSWLKTSVH